MFVSGLGATFNELSETVTMHGTADVTTSNSYLRLQEAYVLTAGSLGQNEGAIAIEESGTETNIGSINAGLGATQLGQYTIPTGKTGYIDAYECSLSPGAGSAAVRSGILRLFTRDNTNNAWRMRLETGVRSDAGGQVTLEAPIECVATTDIRWEFESKSANTQVYIKYAIELHDD